MNTSDSLKDIRILIVEDEALIAEEIRDRLSRLGATIVGVTDNAETAVEMAVHSRPDVVLMDIRLRGEHDGIEAAKAIRRTQDVAIIYLTAHSDVSTVMRAKNTGPFGYLIKPIVGRQLGVAVDVAIHRHRLERARAEQPHKRVPEYDPEVYARYKTLTAREREVFSQIVRGLLNREIAAELGISERTVKAHRAQIMTKMGARTGAGLARLAPLLDL